MKKLLVQRLHIPRGDRTVKSQRERITQYNDPDQERLWMNFKSIVQKTMAEIIDFSERKHQDWFNDANGKIQQLPDAK